MIVKISNEKGEAAAWYNQNKDRVKKTRLVSEHSGPNPTWGLPSNYNYKSTRGTYEFLLDGADTIEVHNVSLEEARDWWEKNGGEGVEYKPSPQFPTWTKAIPSWTKEAFTTAGPWSFRKVAPATPSKTDMVHAPKHYVVTLKSGATIECIDVIESLDLGYHLGNAMKYVWRAGRKDATKKIEDLEKAVAFINRKIGLLRNGG